MAALPGWLTAMAPHAYVVCDGTPMDPGDEAGWRALPVIVESTGRGPAPAPPVASPAR
jgi:hypothetical protein